MRTRGSFSSERSRTGRPSTATRSPGATLAPRVARAPFSVTRPAVIAASMARREPNPERARTLCSFSARAALGGARLGGLCGGRCGLFERRLDGGRGDLRELKRLDDVFQGRQLLERSQPEVVQEGLGGPVEGRAPGHFLVPQHLDPVALLE